MNWQPMASVESAIAGTAATRFNGFRARLAGFSAVATVASGGGKHYRDNWHTIINSYTSILRGAWSWVLGKIIAATF